MNLYLIGYRGSGKSSVAPMVAEKLGRKMIDTDELIEQEVGMSISDIFSQNGAAEFRRREDEVIRQFSAVSELVVSLGGGAPLTESNRRWIKENGKTVWLSADAQTLWERIHRDENSAGRRPDLTKLGGLQEVQQLLGERSPIYAACADYAIDVSAHSPAEIAERIVRWWQSDDKETEENETGS